MAGYYMESLVRLAVFDMMSLVVMLRWMEELAKPHLMKGVGERNLSGLPGQEELLDSWKLQVNFVCLGVCTAGKFLSSSIWS